MSQSKSMHLTYFSSTIALSGGTINCGLDVAPQAGFCERLLVDSTQRCLLCLSGLVSGWGIHDVAVDLPVLGLSGVFWVHTRGGLFRCMVST